MYTLFLLRNQEFEETAALLNPDNSNQSGLHVQCSRPSSASSTGPPSAPPTLKTVDGGDDGSEQTNKSTSRGSRLLSSATPGLSRRKLFSYRQLSAWVSSSHDPPGFGEVQGWQGVGERQFWWHPLSWSPYVLKFLQRWATWVWMDFSVSSLFRCPLSQQSETSQMIFFCFSKDYSCLDVCSYLLSTFKYLSRIKRKQDQPFDKMYLKVLTLPFTILHYTYALLYVQNIRFESEIILIIELYNTTSVFLGDTKCYWQARVLQCESCFLIYK